jgi:hypothetical protein
MGMEYEKNKSRNGSVSRTEYERQNFQNHHKNVPKMRNMTLKVNEDQPLSQSPVNRGGKALSEDTETKPNP